MGSTRSGLTGYSSHKLLGEVQTSGVLIAYKPLYATQAAAAARYITSGELSGSASTPGGADTQVQFNNAGAFGADAALTWQQTADVLTVSGTLVPYGPMLLTVSGLPAAGQATRLRRITNDTRDVWMDTGTQWVSLSHRVADVRMFGATGDGTTDDTAAFQAAADTLSGSGGVLLVPRGTYILTQVLIYSNTWVYGAGAGATILKNTSTTAYNGVIRNYDTTNGNSYLKVSDLTIQRTVNAAAFNEHILCFNCNHVWVERCAFLGPGVPSPPTTTGEKGVHMRGTQYSWIRDNYFEDIPDTPIAINGKDINPADTPMYAIVQGNVIEQSLNWQSSIIIITASRVKSIGNTFHSPVQQDSTYMHEIGSDGTSYAASDIDIIQNTVINAQLFICINQYQRVLIAHNRGATEGAGTSAGSIYQPTLVQAGTLPKDISVEGNQIQGGQINFSIYPGTLTKAVIANNQIFACTSAIGYGITVGSANHIVVQGNTVISGQGGGIGIGGSVTNAVVQGNAAIGNGLAGTAGQGRQEGFYFESFEGVVVNNVARQHPRYGYWFEAPSGVVFRQNMSNGHVTGPLNVTSPTWCSFAHVDFLASGTPEGVIYGQRGSVYQRTDGSTASLWLKYEGQNTTGWRATMLNPSPVAIGVGPGAASPDPGFATGVDVDGGLSLQPQGTNATAPGLNDQARIYVKDSKLIVMYNDGTTRYKFLDLTGYGATWSGTITTL